MSFLRIINNFMQHETIQDCRRDLSSSSVFVVVEENIERIKNFEQNPNISIR